MTLLVDRHRIGTSPSQRCGAKRLDGSAIEPSARLSWRGGAMDRHLNNADATPQPRYRGLTLRKLRLGRVKLVVFSENCPKYRLGGVFVAIRDRV